MSSNNFRLYEYYGANSEDEYIDPRQCLENIERFTDIKEKNGIDYCLNSINKKINEINSNQNKNENIFWIYAKIFSTFTENYIFFFFDFNKEVNGTIFNLLKNFISHKKRKISWMFFNTISYMNNFITLCFVEQVFS